MKPTIPAVCQNRLPVCTVWCAYILPTFTIVKNTATNRNNILNTNNVMLSPLFINFVVAFSYYTMYSILVNVRYTFRCYPTRPQQRELARVFGSVRHAYNWALKLRSDSFKAGKTVNYNTSSSAWTKHRNDPTFSWLKRVSCVPTQQALRQLQTAYKNFFTKVSGYPAFKKKHGKQSAEYTLSAFKWNAQYRNLSFSGLGRLDVHWSRAFQSTPTTVTITKDCAGRYFVTLCLDEPVRDLPKTGEAVGIDLGVLRLATLSTGERVPNPKYLAQSLRHLRRLQHDLARQCKGSNRYRRQRLRIARLHAHIADSRKDYLNKLTTNLVKRFDTLCIEDLNVRGMQANHCLARAISDVGMSAFRSMLTYKCAWYGKDLKLVDRFFPSSKRCHACGYISERLPLDVRNWVCPECSAEHDRDANAALNILTAGHAVPARGVPVRPARRTLRKGSVRRSVNQPALA